MAYPYEWSDDGRERRYAPREEEARRAAQRYAEQEAGQDRERQRRQRGDYASGWWGEEAARQGYDVPGPYGRASEQREDRHRSFESEARRLGEDIGRGWRRLSQGVRGAFTEERGAYERDPRRSGGMFGGQDRPSSLFSHDDGLGARPVGSHRGKGPKGYARSDDRILEEISDRLCDDDWLDASDIELQVLQGEVTLNGHVQRREDKRRAEDIAESVSGVKHLQNNLRVRAPEPPVQQPVQATAAPKAQAGAQSASTATGEEVPPQPPASPLGAR